MLTLQQLVDYLEEYLECRAFSDYCYNGLQVAGQPEVHKIATAVTASLETIEQAVAEGADALIVHHGLFWDRQSVRLVGAMHRKVRLLLDEGLSLLAYHLPLDAHRAVGNNWVAARALGLQELQPFGRCNGVEVGVRGVVPGVSITEWVDRVEAFYGQAGRLALGGSQTVESAAILSGGAHRQLTEALEAGVDCFITGTGDEPNWGLANEEGIHFMAMGHAATERVGPRALKEHLQDRFDLPAVFISDVNPY